MLPKQKRQPRGGRERQAKGGIVDLAQKLFSHTEGTKQAIGMCVSNLYLVTGIQPIHHLLLRLCSDQRSDSAGEKGGFAV